MIRYALACDQGHGFEGWFRSSDDFDRQAERDLLSCPHCQSARVTKSLMAPAVRLQSEPRAAETKAAIPVAAAPAEAVVPAALVPPEARALVEKLREIKGRLLEGSENVGSHFAEEARRIHYGEAPARAVHGEATPDQARALVEEGVGILPLPVLPDEHN